MTDREDQDCEQDCGQATLKSFLKIIKIYTMSERMFGTRVPYTTR
jgi:hypothetical protein